jgi:hypothetical protein
MERSFVGAEVGVVAGALAPWRRGYVGALAHVHLRVAQVRLVHIVAGLGVGVRAHVIRVV